MTDLSQTAKQEQEEQVEVLKSPFEASLEPAPALRTIAPPLVASPPRRRKPKPTQPTIDADLRPTSSTSLVPPQRKTHKHQPSPGVGSLFAPLCSSLKLALRLIPWLFPLMGYIVPLALVGIGSWWLAYYFVPQLAQLAADAALSLPKGLLRFGGGALGGVSPALGVVWCSIVGCEKDNKQLRSGVAKIVGARADQALDIFQSMIQLSSGDQVGLSLHPVEAWELATAVRYTSEIEDRVFISDTLSELGDGIRDVRDEVIDLNAQGINAFTWIEHEFSRIERLLTSSKTVSDKQLEKMVDQLFEKINTDLNELLRSLDKAIPLATRTSDLGRRVFGHLKLEESELQKEREEKGVVGAFLSELQGWKGKQLRRDLELCKRSAEGVSVLWLGLENTRTAFKQYQANVGQFKAGVIGFHAAGHGLTPEDEIASLSRVMSDFRRTLEEVKSQGRKKRPVPSQRELAEGRSEEPFSEFV